MIGINTITGAMTHIHNNLKKLIDTEKFKPLLFSGFGKNDIYVGFPAGVKLNDFFEENKFPVFAIERNDNFIDIYKYILSTNTLIHFKELETFDNGAEKDFNLMWLNKITEIIENFNPEQFLKKIKLSKKEENIINGIIFLTKTAMYNRYFLFYLFYILLALISYLKRLSKTKKIKEKPYDFFSIYEAILQRRTLKHSSLKPGSEISLYYKSNLNQLIFSLEYLLNSIIRKIGNNLIKEYSEKINEAYILILLHPTITPQIKIIYNGFIRISFEQLIEFYNYQYSLLHEISHLILRIIYPYNKKEEEINELQNEIIIKPLIDKVLEKKDDLEIFKNNKNELENIYNEIKESIKTEFISKYNNLNKLMEDIKCDLICFLFKGKEYINGLLKEFSFNLLKDSLYKYKKEELDGKIINTLIRTIIVEMVKDKKEIVKTMINNNSIFPFIKEMKSKLTKIYEFIQDDRINTNLKKDINNNEIKDILKNFYSKDVIILIIKWTLKFLAWIKEIWVYKRLKISDTFPDKLEKLLVLWWNKTPELYEELKEKLTGG